MKKIIVSLTILILVVLGVTVFITKSNAASAVAIKRWGNGHAWGISWGFKTVEEARAEALKRCKADYGDGCYITLQHSGPSWWAIVHKPGNPGILCVRGGYPSEEEAINAAQSCAGGDGEIKNSWYDSVGPTQEEIQEYF